MERGRPAPLLQPLPLMPTPTWRHHPRPTGVHSRPFPQACASAVLVVDHAGCGRYSCPYLPSISFHLLTHLCWYDADLVLPRASFLRA